jgi:hypothetical protein
MKTCTQISDLLFDTELHTAVFWAVALWIAAALVITAIEIAVELWRNRRS